MNNKMKKWLTAAIAILVSSLISFLYVLYLNKYPFFWNDSETYIGYAVKSVVTTYGTTAYPVFIKTSLGLISLWFTLFAQMMLGACVLWKFCRSYLPKITIPQFIFLNLFLAFTSYHFFINTVMPDIFLPLGFLLFLVFVKEEISVSLISYYVLFCFCVIAHNGFPYTFILFSFLFLPILMWKNKTKKFLIKCAFIFSLILIAAFICKPLLGLTYKKDSRKKRDINFFCRQIILTKYENLLQETLDIGCQNFPSKVCDTTPSKRDILRLKYFNTWEPDCKHIFLTAISDSKFRSKLILHKMSSILKMYTRLGLLGNSGSNLEQHEDIKGIITSDPFLKMENSHVNQDIIQFKSSLQSQKSLVKFIFKFSLFGMLMLLITSVLLRKKYPWLIIRSEFIYFLIAVAFFISATILFYGIFSRPGNSRYAMRLGWLIPFSFYLLLLNTWTTYKELSQSIQKSQ